jgi:hypothetical protein
MHFMSGLMVHSAVHRDRAWQRCGSIRAALEAIYGRVWSMMNGGDEEVAKIFEIFFQHSGSSREKAQ